MYDYITPWKEKIAVILTALIKEIDASLPEIDPVSVIAEIPPDPAMGDIGFPMFSYAKIMRKGPPQIALLVAEQLAGSREQGTENSEQGKGKREKGEEGSEQITDNREQRADKVMAQGPYVNVFFDRGFQAKQILKSMISDDGKLLPAPCSLLPEKKIMVEFSSPNTNKPLHLGHLRNDVLGESISRILKACGADVRKVCIINDRGIHICKSMLAYKEDAAVNSGQGKTPESENVKSDRFVGDRYVEFSKNLKNEVDKLIADGIDPKKAEQEAPSMKRAQELLRLWEAGDSETVELWKKMNAWAIEGMKKTYYRTGVSFDKYYYESETYMLGKDEVLKGLQKGIFYKQEDGAVAVDLSEENLGTKILLRSDGTSIYITQDFGTAINRHEDWPFDQMIYVVGSEQQYHFKVLFILLKKMGYDWADNLYHLSYGMVNLPEGKMKSREGTVVDADDLIDSLRDMALEEIRQKEREEEVGNPQEVAEKIALGALHYFLLQVNPVKDMLFDPKESLSFNGNTGPYLQYMGARICSMLRKAEKREKGKGKREQGVGNSAQLTDFALLVADSEWELIKTLVGYSKAVSEAAESLDPSRLTGYLYELAKSFSRFYQECHILNCEDKALSTARLELSRIVMLVLKDAFYLVCIPFLEKM